MWHIISLSAAAKKTVQLITSTKNKTKYFFYSLNVELHHRMNPGCTTTIKTIYGILSLSRRLLQKTVHLITSTKTNYIFSLLPKWWTASHIKPRLYYYCENHLWHIISLSKAATKNSCLITSTKTKTNYIFFLLSKCWTASHNKPRLYYYYRNHLWHIISLTKAATKNSSPENMH